MNPSKLQSSPVPTFPTCVLVAPIPSPPKQPQALPPAASASQTAKVAEVYRKILLRGGHIGC